MVHNDPPSEEHQAIPDSQTSDAATDMAHDNLYPEIDEEIVTALFAKKDNEELDNGDDALPLSRRIVCIIKKAQRLNGRTISTNSDEWKLLDRQIGRAAAKTAELGLSPHLNAGVGYGPLGLPVGLIRGEPEPLAYFSKTEFDLWKERMRHLNHAAELIEYQIAAQEWSEPKRASDWSKIFGWKQTKTSEKLEEWRAAGKAKGGRQAIQIRISVVNEYRAVK